MSSYWECVCTTCSYCTDDVDTNIIIILFCHISIQNGCTPLYVASEYGHTEVADLLMKNGAKVNQATTVWRLLC